MGIEQDIVIAKALGRKCVLHADGRCYRSVVEKLMYRHPICKTCTEWPSYSTRDNMALEGYAKAFVCGARIEYQGGKWRIICSVPEELIVTDWLDSFPEMFADAMTKTKLEPPPKGGKVLDCKRSIILNPVVEQLLAMRG